MGGCVDLLDMRTLFIMLMMVVHVVLEWGDRGMAMTTASTTMKLWR